MRHGREEIAMVYMKDDVLKSDAPLLSKLSIFLIRPIKH